jgi:hypothetical protein
VTLAIEPPLVIRPPALGGNPNSEASHATTLRSITLAAGDSCQKLQFWLSIAAIASANGPMPFGGPSTYARNFGCVIVVEFGITASAMSPKRPSSPLGDSGKGSSNSREMASRSS